MPLFKSSAESENLAGPLQCFNCIVELRKARLVRLLKCAKSHFVELPSRGFQVQIRSKWDYTYTTIYWLPGKAGNGGIEGNNAEESEEAFETVGTLKEAKRAKKPTNLQGQPNCRTRTANHASRQLFSHYCTRFWRIHQRSNKWRPSKGRENISWGKERKQKLTQFQPGCQRRLHTTLAPPRDCTNLTFVFFIYLSFFLLLLEIFFYRVYKSRWLFHLFCSASLTSCACEGLD